MRKGSRRIIRKKKRFGIGGGDMFALYVTNPHKLQWRYVGEAGHPVGEEVKVRPTYGGICGSDISVWKGKLPHADYPVRAGHELVGVVVEKGERAPYDVGTRVVVLPNTYCGECEFCRKGQTNICEKKRSLGVNMDGVFSSEFVISSRYVLPVPDDLADERAVLVEPFAVVVHALGKVGIDKGMKAAVVGCGNEGMMAAVLARYLGADVTAIDVNPLKLETVKTIVDVRTFTYDTLPEEKYDVVIEAAGAASAAEQAVELARPGGHVVLLGLVNEATFPVVRIVRHELTIHGSIIYQFPGDYMKAIHYLRTMPFPVEQIIAKTFPIAEYEKAYEAAASGQPGKVVLQFG